MHLKNTVISCCEMPLKQLLAVGHLKALTVNPIFSWTRIWQDSSIPLLSKLVFKHNFTMQLSFSLPTELMSTLIGKEIFCNIGPMHLILNHINYESSLSNFLSTSFWHLQKGKVHDNVSHLNIYTPLTSFSPYSQKPRDPPGKKCLSQTQELTIPNQRALRVLLWPFTD